MQLVQVGVFIGSGPDRPGQNPDRTETGPNLDWSYPGYFWNCLDHDSWTHTLQTIQPKFDIIPNLTSAQKKEREKHNHKTKNLEFRHLLHYSHLFSFTKVQTECPKRRFLVFGFALCPRLKSAQTEGPSHKTKNLEKCPNRRSKPKPPKKKKLNSQIGPVRSNCRSDRSETGPDWRPKVGKERTEDGTERRQSGPVRSNSVFGSVRSWTV